MQTLGFVVFVSIFIVGLSQIDIDLPILPICRSLTQQLNPCGSCAPKCINGIFTESSTTDCTSACVCPRGYIMDENQRCIPIERCRGVPECPCKKEYLPCGPACGPICIDGNLALPICRPCCRPGCFCKEGYIMTNNGTCVRACIVGAVELDDGVC